MAGERKYTRIPPESLGDRISLRYTAILPYDGKSPSYDWVIDGFYTVDDGGGNTVIIHIHKVQELSTVAGLLYISIDSDSEYQNRSPADDQVIYDQDLVSRANVNGSVTDLYYNATEIVGGSNPEYALNVDRFGAANTRFSEGDPQVSSFGHIRVSNPKLLAQYDFNKRSYSDQFSTSNEFSGETTWVPDQGCINISIRLDRDRATNTSTLFHPYVPGAGNLFLMATRLGDAGSVGDATIRNWGAFDATDGMLFQLLEDKLRVVHRVTENGGAVANYAYDQSDWNKDTLDGTGGESNPSGMLLDLTKINNYWMDYQYLGGGRVRWGVFYKGDRITCHEIFLENGSESHGGIYNALSNPNRPVCWAAAKRAAELGSTGTVTTDERIIYAHGAGIYEEAEVDVLQESNCRQYSRSFNVVSDKSDQYAFSVRPQLELPALVDNGANNTENHALYAPQSINIRAKGSRIIVDNADVSSNVLSVTSNVSHYLSLSSSVDLYDTDTLDGSYIVSSIVSPTSFTADAPGISNTSGESGELVSDRDEALEDRGLEVSMYIHSVIRGDSWTRIHHSTTESDKYADYLHNGHLVSNFTVDGEKEFELIDFKTYQNGTIRSISDQSFARNSQDITSLSADDIFSVGSNKVVVKVGQHPDHTSHEGNFHYFEDKGEIIVRHKNRDGITFSKDLDNTNYPTLLTSSADAQYISFIDKDRAWMYDSLTGIDSDRSVRVLQLSTDPTGTISVGDTITLDTGGHTAIAKNIYVDGSNYFLGVKRRDGSDFDGYTGTINSSAFTVTVVTESSDRIGGTGVWSGWTLDNERTTFDLDYETSLLSIDTTGWDDGGGPWNDATDDAATIETGNGNGIVLYGPTPIQTKWCLVVRSLEKNKTDTNVIASMCWKERIQ